MILVVTPIISPSRLGTVPEIKSWSPVEKESSLREIVNEFDCEKVGEEKLGDISWIEFCVKDNTSGNDNEFRLSKLSKT